MSEDRRYTRTRVIEYRNNSRGWLAFAAYAFVGFATTLALTGNVFLAVLLALLWPMAIPFMVASMGVAIAASVAVFVVIIVFICWLLGD